MLAFWLAILCREPEHLWDGACGHGLSLSQNFAALFTPSSVMVLTPLRVGWVATDDSSTAVHTVSCSWHFNVSMLATTQCKKRSFFLSKLRATQNFGGKHKYLEGSVKAQPASKAKQSYLYLTGCTRKCQLFGLGWISSLLFHFWKQFQINRLEHLW